MSFALPYKLDDLRLPAAELQTAQPALAVEPASAASSAYQDISRTPNAVDYADEQIRGLVQQVFFPGWPKSSRQVVLCAVDQTAIVGTCARIARTMAATLPGTVCAVEANLHNSTLESALAAPPELPPRERTNGCTQVGNKLWFVPAHTLAEAATGALGAVSLRSRLSELRRKFDYSLIQAPPAEFFTETVLLGQLSDGVILVLQARRTHRAVARKMQQILRAAGVPVLGTILTDRTFPIPEPLYRRL
jgi:Mrp family chromosome partitioning ATPase